MKEGMQAVASNEQRPSLISKSRKGSYNQMSKLHKQMSMDSKKNTNRVTVEFLVLLCAISLASRSIEPDEAML